MIRMYQDAFGIYLANSKRNIPMKYQMTKLYDKTWVSDNWLFLCFAWIMWKNFYHKN